MPCNGHVIPRTPIAIDNFQKRNVPQAKVFFLTHFHADHMVGLTSNWDNPIYTSRITGELLVNIIGVDPSLVKCLEVGDVHLIPLDAEGWEMASVTLYDANHCPGSVMFLFQGYFGNILYTGDFRYVADLLDFSSLPEIDVLYLDNTYCSPKCVFPVWQVALDSLLTQVHTCLCSSRRVFLGLDNLGKEEIFEMVAKESHSNIHVPYARKQILDVLGLSHLVTSDPDNCKIFVVPTSHISGLNLKNWNEEVPTCAVLATARYSGFNFAPYSRHRRIHVVPLSNHSCYSELVEFVKHVQPKTIVPIVSKDARGIFNTDISDRADMSVFNSFLKHSPQQDFDVPDTVEVYMNSGIHTDQFVAAKRKGVQRRIPKKPKPLVQGVHFQDSGDLCSDSDQAESEICDEPIPNPPEAVESNSEDFIWEVVHITSDKSS